MFSFFKKKPLLDTESQELVVAAIQRAEKNTTGELRVYMESKCTYVNPVDRAWEIFAKLGMDQTERRNAVLVYLALDDHQYAIVGDKNIYELAGGQTFWENAAMHLKSHLKTGQIAKGIEVCVNELGGALAEYFPYDPNITKNELPDDIVFGK